MSEQPSVDWERIDTLISARPGALLDKSERGEALLAQLGQQVHDAIGQLRAKELGAGEEFADLDRQRATQERLATRCDKIIVKAQAEGREALLKAASGRKAGHEAKAAELRAAIDARADEQTRVRSAITELEAKVARIAIVRAGEAPAPTDGASAGGPHQVDAGAAGVSDDDLLSSLDSLMAEEAGSAAVAPAQQPGGAAPAPLIEEAAGDLGFLDGLEAAAALATGGVSSAPAPAPAAAGDLDAEFAALLEAQGAVSSGAAVAPAPSAGREDMDAILASLPEMVEVADGELPDGVELPPEPQVPAVVAAAPKLPLKPDQELISSKPPAKPDVELHAKKNAAPSGESKSRTWLWVVVGVLVVGGAFVGTLAVMGKL